MSEPKDYACVINELKLARESVNQAIVTLRSSESLQRKKNFTPRHTPECFQHLAEVNQRIDREVKNLETLAKLAEEKAKANAG